MIGQLFLLLNDSENKYYARCQLSVGLNLTALHWSYEQKRCNEPTKRLDPLVLCDGDSSTRGVGAFSLHRFPVALSSIHVDLNQRVSERVRQSFQSTSAARSKYVFHFLFPSNISFSLGNPETFLKPRFGLLYLRLLMPSSKFKSFSLHFRNSD